MYKKALFFAVGIALAAAPLSASAATIADLQAQITSLIAQIQALQSGQTSTSVGVSAGGSAAVGTPARAALPCYPFSHSVSRGHSGEDVSSLQQFLADQGYFSGSATGYFGAQTQAALGKWQEANNLAVRGGIGWGVFGPRSRLFFKNWCGQNRQSFSADPQSGPAPLTTTFTTSDSINSSSTYSVDFGDGQNGQMMKGSCIAITAIRGGQGGIRCSYTVSHTYAANGTYTAKLLKQQAWSCPNGMMCAAMMPAPQTVATLTITVGSATGANFSASPTSGSAPLPVTFTESNLSGGTYVVDFGDGSHTVITVPQIECIRAPCYPAPQTTTHTYTSTGTYTATLSQYIACLYSTPPCYVPTPAPIGSVTITVSGSSQNLNDQLINAPGNVTLTAGGIAEVRNRSFYFTLIALTSSSATIQITTVGCWNSFPSDTPPQMRCMIAVMPIAPVTLSPGQTYSANNYSITLTSLTSTFATFSIN